jgi:D-glycero-alpha-D-manno-heptose-7-phosphate kinase
LIVTRTPFRVSFFGGGTDYPPWFLEHGGAVIATTIDKFCYISLRYLPPFFEHKHRIVYSDIENVKRTQDIKHPAVKAIFEWAGVTNGLEVHHDGDLPARSGLGSSSSFTVGLINALTALDSHMISKKQLAKNAIHVEQNIIKENVGSQDQISAAYGGFNRIDFLMNNTFSVNPIIVSDERLKSLEDHLMLFFTGFSRIASEIAASKIANLKNCEIELKLMLKMVDQSIDLLQSSTPIEEFGKMLHESWQLKRTLSDKVSSSEIDQIYEAAMTAGAEGGKILGAGGGGFLLIFAKPEHQQKIKETLHKLIHVPFKFEGSGSQVVLYQPNGL